MLLLQKERGGGGLDAAAHDIGLLRRPENRGLMFHFLFFAFREERRRSKSGAASRAHFRVNVSKPPSWSQICAHLFSLVRARFLVRVFLLFFGT